ncbi:hypothetical protein E4Q08_01900 [Candidatus Accumulibacter phosphatis]|uniref:Uncharacterized protein n=1 Tax=Candidatus Accumulibacter contiguus TaxID=2954381 RepID=A0ABX1T376_9PROT|nr:hypothetical protein [Candidatus Accumulibacter contiguus]
MSPGTPLRQTSRWREYVRVFYRAHMPKYFEQNVFGHTRALPGWFWNGQTRIRCLSHAIGQSLFLSGWSATVARRSLNGSSCRAPGLAS